MDTQQNNDAALAETLQDPNAGQIEQPTEQLVTDQEQKQVDPPKDEAQLARFAALREARQKAEAERDQIKAELERVREKDLHTSPEQTQSSPFGTVAPDDLVEGRHLSKYDQEIQKLRQELEQTRHQAITVAVEGRLKSQYTDFDSVVSKENIEVLQKMHPEIAATIQHSPDLYGKAVTAYTLIKKLGIAGSSQSAEQQARVEQNLAKPKTAASVSPLVQATKFGSALTKQRKREIHAETLRIIKGG